jgi:hypothetical protein
MERKGNNVISGFLQDQRHASSILPAHPCTELSEGAEGLRAAPLHGIGQDHVGALFRDHDGRRVGVTAHHRRHHRGVSHP